LITFIGRSHMMGSSKSTVIISCINVPILFSKSQTSHWWTWTQKRHIRIPAMLEAKV